MTSPDSKDTDSPLDMDGQFFNPDMYLHKLFQTHALKDIMDKEDQIVRETQQLHSEMQTLVYENYNKFISATDTIKKMKSDFKQMETEMDLLGTNMNSITSFSEQITNTLKDTRQQISKLSGVHSLLKRLQFLFQLPNKLKSLMEEGNYAEAVHNYLHTQQVLNHYSHLESFSGIQNDCLKIVDELKTQLRSQFQTTDATAKDVTQSVELLLLLGEPADSLYQEILMHASNRLNDQISVLSADDSTQDLIEFVDLVNNSYLSDLGLVVTSYNDMFVTSSEDKHWRDEAVEELNEFVLKQMMQLMNCIETRVEKEQDNCDNAVLVRALDRLYSNLNAFSTLLENEEFSQRNLELVMKTGDRECGLQLKMLEGHLSDWIRTVRTAVAQQESSSPPPEQSHSEILTSLVLSTVEKIKGVLHDLTMFIQPELSFSSNKEFVTRFSLDCVEQRLLHGFLQHLIVTARGFAKSPQPSLPTLLVLAKACLEFSSSHVAQLGSLLEEWFHVQLTKERAESRDELTAQLQGAAQDLLDHFVRLQGNTISTMLRKSVETRDWLHSLEPRTVRAVMKRVLEELGRIESQVGGLFEEGSRGGDRSSDSSRRSRHHRSQVSNWSSHSTHVHKLFSERIDIFAPVQFNKMSILTGIVKISLKTLLECVRLRTFSKFGFQQIQVDTHYLQLNLWRYVADENLVHLLLDEILGSAVARCLNPVLMEPSVVEVICERG